jgi:hypothetical protein
MGTSIAAAVPPAAWAHAVAEQAPHSRCEALLRTAALLDAVGLRAALGGEDVRLRDSCSAARDCGAGRTAAECEADAAEVLRCVRAFMLRGHQDGIDVCAE